MRVRIAEYPSCAMCVENDGQRSGRADRVHDPNGDLTRGASRNRKILDLHLGLKYFAGLGFIDGLAALFRAKLIQIRRIRRIFNKLLCCGL
ncbi:hypothetical protein D3C87_1968970 [compost metagenome]